MLDPMSIASLVSGGISGIASIFGASQAKKAAQDNVNRVQSFYGNQQSVLDVATQDMLARQRAMPTYQADLTPYQAMADKARMNEIQATGQTRAPGTQFALDTADQGYANLVQATGRLGGSRADMATSLLMGQQNVGAQKQGALATGQQMMFQNQMNARQQNLSTLGQVAAAKSMENYRTFASQQANQQGMINLLGQTTQSKMNLAQQGFQSEMAARGAVQQANDAMWMGGANILGTIGSGLGQIGMQNMKMKQLEKMRTLPPETQQDVRDYQLA